jgi:hypothetical protein
MNVDMSAGCGKPGQAHTILRDLDGKGEWVVVDAHILECVPTGCFK